MDNEIKTWLYNMLNAIAEIENFFADRPMLFTNYQADLRTKRAVERSIEIIGEAMNRFIKRIAPFKSQIPESSTMFEIGSFMAMIRFQMILFGGL